MAQIVEAAIVAQMIDGRAAAVAYLVQQEVRVPTDVIGRALAGDPLSRRGKY